VKTIVTHHRPDVDAITAVWLVKTFYTGWEEADVAFVPAGDSLGGNLPDSDPDIIHVDTGEGRFDHHQTNAKTCATRLVFEYLREERIRTHGQGAKKHTEDNESEMKRGSHHWHEEALDRLTQVVVDIDHFGHVYWPQPNRDIYDFSLEGMLDGWKLLNPGTEHDRDILEWGMRALDGIYQTLMNKAWAEKEIAEKGVEFDTPWGKGMGIETMNDDTLPIAQKRGMAIAVRKDPNKGYVRIKARPGSGADLTPIYETLKKADPQASWYLHASKLMLLNGSAKNPKMRASKLTLSEIIDTIKRSK